MSEASVVSGDELLARWYARHFLRWPLVLAVWVGIALVPYIALVGAGRKEARESLAESEADLASPNRPTLADDDNAAVHWGQAVEVFVPEQPTPEELERDGDFDGYYKPDPDDPATYGAGGAYWRQVRDNARTFQFTAEAAAVQQCNWGLDYSRPFDDGITDHLIGIRALAAVLLHRGTIAIGEGEWSTVSQVLGELFALRRHLATDSITVCQLMALAVEGMAMELASRVIGTPEAPAPALEAADALACEISSDLLPRVEVLETERKVARHTLDSLAVGAAVLSGGQALTPLSTSWYSATWRLDRACLDHNIDRGIRILEDAHAGDFAFLQRREDDVETSLPHIFVIGAHIWSPKARSLGDHVAKRLMRCRMIRVGVALRRWAGPDWPPPLDALGLSPSHLNPLSATGTMLPSRLDEEGSLVLEQLDEHGLEVEFGVRIPAPEERR